MCKRSPPDRLTPQLTGPAVTRRNLNATYDPFGTLIIDWNSASPNTGPDRGFTGHEHLDDVGIVNMNGRVFDPLVARFMQADPLIQDPTNLQNYDRYAYCFNSPTTCTDPSGYSAWTSIRGALVRIVAAVADAWGCAGYCSAAVGAYYGSQNGGGLKGAIVGGVASYLAFDLSPANGVSFGGGYTQSAVAGFFAGVASTGTVEGGIKGAFTAGVFFGAGQLIESNSLGTQGSIALHGVAGCVTSVASGSKCGPGALSAAFSKAATVYELTTKDPVGGTIVSAVIGGTTSLLGGGKFSNGATTAAFGYLFNCAMHECWKQGALGAVKAVGGGLTVATGAAICTSLAGCALGAPMAAFGASDAWQGGGMVVDAVQGISSEGFNLIKTGFQLAMPEWGGAVYEGTSLGLNVGAIGAKVPLIVGASDGIERATSMFGVTVSRWDNARAVLGNVVSQSVNRLMLTGSAIGKVFGFGKEVNAAGSGP